MVKRLIKKLPCSIVIAHKLRPYLNQYLGRRISSLLINPQIETVAMGPQGSVWPKKPSGLIISIIVPVYNAEDYLRHCLDSVLAQTYKNWECILVDDFSSDGSLEIAKTYQKRDKRFRIVVHRASGGPSAARNTGILKAIGEYLVFLDADDFLYKDSLRDRICACEVSSQSENLAGAYCAWESVAETASDIPPGKPRSGMRLIDFYSEAGDCPFVITAPLIRRQLVLDLGGFNESFGQAEDWELWYKVLRHGFIFVPTNTVGVAYRQKATSLIREGVDEHLRSSERLFFAAHRAMEPDEIKIERSGIYRYEWGYYKKAISLFSRQLSFSAMAYLGGRADAFEKLVARFDSDFWVISARHTNYEAALEAGVLRYLGVIPADKKVVKDLPDLLAATRKNFYFALSSVQGQSIKSEFSDLEIYRIPRNPEADLILLPHKDYHVWSIADVVTKLREKGWKCCFVDLSYAYRDERAKSKLKELGLSSITYNELLLSGGRPKAYLCFNDWDTQVVRPIIEAANNDGIPTIGVVEGIQDFDDADTGRIRKPYKTVKNVMLAGDYDKKFFENCGIRTFVAGVARIEELMREDVHFPEKPMVVVNLNFTYNVLTDKRDLWLDSVVDACRMAGVDYLISQHPADTKDLAGYNKSSKSMYDLIREGTIFVSRFSSGILESLAMGKPAIYHNPHGEKVDKFQECYGLYPVTDSVGSLAEALSNLKGVRQSVRDRATPFLRMHCDVGKSTSVVDRSVNIIESILKGE